MIPTLYEENETGFLSNGLGRLTDVISCVVKQNKEGVYELSMEYPLDGIHADEITNNRFIYAVPERGKDCQPFRIRNIEKAMNGRMKITARHVCYDLNYYVCREFGRTDVMPYKLVPSLYASDKLTIIGELTDLVSTTVTKVSSQQGKMWNLAMVYPKTGLFAGGMSAGNYISAQPAVNRDLAMFEIKTIDSTDPDVLQVFAQAPVTPSVRKKWNEMTVTNALAAVGGHIISQFPFSLAVSADADTTWKNTVKEFWNESPVPVKPLLFGAEGSITDVFGGEWEFDHYACILHEERGSDNGVQYRYGKNIKSITERINIDDIYTHAFSYWKGTASSSTNTDEGEYYTKSGDVLEILGEEYAAMFPAQRTLIIDASGEFESEPAKEQLNDYTRKYAADHSSGEPQVTVDVDIVDLAGTAEYEDIAALEQVNLYDTVTVIFRKFGISLKSKVTEIEYDALKDRNTRVVIGSVTTSLANIIAQTRREITSAQNHLKAWADKAMERSTEALAGWYGGNIRKNYNKNDHKQQSMFIMDTDDQETASRAVKFDGGGIGVSGSGVDGSYSYMVGMDGGSLSFSDEFAGDGNTNASFLKRGTISDGTSYWNLQTGAAYFELTGLKITDGTAEIKDVVVTHSLIVDNTDILQYLDNLDNAISNINVGGLASDIADLTQRVETIEQMLGIVH